MDLLSIYKFIKFNKNFHKNQKKNGKIILIELFNNKSHIIAYSLFLKSLSQIHAARAVAYSPNFLNLKNKIKILIFSFFRLNYIGVFNSITNNSLLIPNKTDLSTKKAKKIFKQSLKFIKKKQDILKLKFFNIPIGDLLYDVYIREHNLSTIDYTTQHFKKYLQKFILIFLYWHKYLDKKKVAAINCSHTSYLLGLPPRIAIYKNIDTFNVTAHGAYRLSKKFLLRFSGNKLYRKNFKKNFFKVRLKAFKVSKVNLLKRFRGENDLAYNSQNSINPVFQKKTNFNKENKQNQKRNIKILIATHCFNDAPHVYGNFIFPDFFDWLDFLGNFSNKQKNFNWYIKLHPSYYDRNYANIRYFINKYKNFSLLPKHITHSELINEGIDLALTVHGSIAYEYSYFNVPVITAGPNPSMSYNYCFNPVSKKEYLKLLKKIKDIVANKKKVNKNQILENYFMKYVVEYNLLSKYKLKKEDLNSDKIYQLFLNDFIASKIFLILKEYKKFILSGDHRLIRTI